MRFSDNTSQRCESTSSETVLVIARGHVLACARVAMISVLDYALERATMNLSCAVKSVICVAAAVTLGIASPAAGQISGIDPEQRLKDLGIKLPAPTKSLAIYKKIVVVDKMAYLSGHIPIDENGQIMKGKVGRDVDVDSAAKAARRCAIALLATLRNEVGSLNNVKRLVKTTGMVNCTPDETQQPEVINGCSQLIVDIFGEENGKGARAAVGMASLPRGAICEIEMIFELK